MKFYSILFLLVMIGFTSVGQSKLPHPDSLYYDARMLLQDGKFEQVLAMGSDFKSHFNTSKDSAYLFHFFRTQAYANYYSGNLKDAEKNWKAVLAFPSRFLTPERQADIKFNLCECYRKLNDLYRSHKFCLESFSEFRKLGISDGAVQAQLVLAEHWITMNRLDSATFYVEASLKEASSKNQTQNIAQSHQLMSKIFSQKELWNQAIKEMQKAIDLFESVGYWPNVMFGYNEIASFNLRLNKFHGAAQAASNVLNFLDKAYLPNQHIQALIEMAFSYSSLNLLEEAKYWLDSAQTILPEIPNQDHYLLTRFFEVQKDLAIKNGDGLTANEANKKLLNLMEDYKKLNPDSVITLSKLNYELELVKEQYGREILINKYLLYSLIFSISCFLVCLYFWIRYYRYRKILKEKLKVQSKEIEELRNEQVLDYHINLKPLNRKLKFYVIRKNLKDQLNDTDMKILELISVNPNISNKELCDSVNISYYGLRSALKKMYKVFDVNDSASNKKLAMLTNALNLSSDNLNELKD